MLDWIIIILIIYFIIRKEDRSISQNKVQTKKHSQYGIVTKTLKGHLVRSIGESKIANFLYMAKIKYEYEKKVKGMLTDFYLPDYRLYIEYWGMVNAPDPVGERYRKNMIKKMGRYKRNRLRLLNLYPKDLNNLHNIIITKLAIYREN